MRRKCIPILAIAVALTLVGSLGVLTLQQAYAPRNCGQCVEFKKMTHEFEKSVIGLVGNPNEGPIPHLRELVDAYAQEFNRILLGGPDTLPGLLEQYQQSVLAVFINPPDPDKQAQHDQIKEFRQLTQDFIKDVVDAASQPPPDDG